MQNNIIIYIDEDLKDKHISLYVPDKISSNELLSLFKRTITKMDLVLNKKNNSYYLTKKIIIPDSNYLYKLKFNSSEDCKKVLNILKTNYIYLDDTNSFLITSTKKQYKLISSFLDKVDIKQKQVILKIMILEFQDDITKERGVKYGSIYKGITGATEYALNTIVAPLSTNNLTLKNINFYSALRLLNEDKKVNVKQFPYVLAKNNKSFKFEAVENIPYLVKTTKTDASNTSVQTSVDYKDVGLKINGKSFIYDDYITLDLDLIIEDLISSSSSSTPQTYKRHLQSNTNIQYEKVLLLSGIKRNKHNKTNWNIPIISKIPYLGQMFQYSYDSDTQINITISIEVIRSD